MIRGVIKSGFRRNQGVGIARDTSTAKQAGIDQRWRGGMWASSTMLAVVVVLIGSVTPSEAAATFDDLPLAPNSYWNGSDMSGGFTTGGVFFPNSYNPSWMSWEGWAYSNQTDNVTPGWMNQYSAITGGGVGGSANYGVAYLSDWADDALRRVSVGFANGAPGVHGFYVTNTTYAYYSMLNGDSFAKKFGGPSGTDPDYFRLVITGLDAAYNPIATSPVTFYLADFRSADPAQDYIVNDWRFVDVGSLVSGGAAYLSFSLESSDVGPWGTNTPLYFAVDQVPEPASAVLLLAAAAGAWFMGQRRRCA